MSQTANWIQTVPGKGWFTILRLYGPLESFFTKQSFQGYALGALCHGGGAEIGGMCGNGGQKCGIKVLKARFVTPARVGTLE